MSSDLQDQVEAIQGALDVGDYPNIGGFAAALRGDKKLLKQFVGRNPKVFKRAELMPASNQKLFGYLNRRPASDKLWDALQLAVVLHESALVKKDDKLVRLLVKAIESFDRSSDDDSDDEVPPASQMMKEMLSAIKSKVGDKKDFSMDDLMSLSKDVGDKFGEKIATGEMKMDDMMSTIMSMVQNSDEFMKDLEDLKDVKMPDIGDMMATLGKSGGPLSALSGMLGGNAGSSPLASLLGGALQGQSPLAALAEKFSATPAGSRPGTSATSGGAPSDLTPEQLKELEEFYSRLQV